MNAIPNEARRVVASAFRKTAKFNAKRWSERVLTALDALATVALWGFFASTVVRFALFPPEERGDWAALTASTLICLTFATITVYVLRETVWIWRESPCRLPKSELRARLRSASLPLWATAAVVASASGTSYSDAKFATVWAAAFYVLCVDVGAAFFARRWGATVARDWLLALENDAASSDKEPSNEDAATSEKTAICDVEEGDVEPSNETPVDALGEENAELAEEPEGETLATQRRVRAEDGETRIFGSVAVEFEADAEVAPVFIAFCPPFEGLPSFDFEQIAGPEIALKTTSVQPFGVRLEAKRRVAQTAELQDFATDEKIRIEYFAAFPPFDETSETAF
ncbi:MAG: hypothetical protein IJO40_01915 [Thermoguttaceae bacterium]|nr:hypothetical protein [Thermoguttaceae bacterium]